MEENYDKNVLEALKIAEQVSKSNREAASETKTEAGRTNAVKSKMEIARANTVKSKTEIARANTVKSESESNTRKTVQKQDDKKTHKSEPVKEQKTVKKHKKEKPKNAPKKLKDPWSFKRKLVTGILIAVLVLAVIPSCILVTFANKGKNELAENATSDAISFNDENVSSLKVSYNGTNYIYNEDVITILVLGVDNSYEDTADASQNTDVKNRDNDIVYTDENGSEYVRYGGTVDMCFLLILNMETNEMNVLSINRDSMTDVNICTTEGVAALTDEMQLTLAYSYADGGIVSCENFTAAVSGLLKNLPINAYIAVDMEGLGDINDAVNGVTLIASETVSADIFENNSVTLIGEMAYDYLEYVYLDSIGDNSSRIARQNQYFAAWINRLQQSYSIEKSVLKDVYNAAAPYIETNLDMYQMIYLAYVVKDMDLTVADVAEIDGEYTRTDYFDEYRLDEESLVEFLLEYFYTEAE